MKRFVALVVLMLALAGGVVLPPVAAPAQVIEITTPMPPPGWALLERRLLRDNTAACREFFARYFDERGYLRCVERWGGDDGPDDAIECCNDWPILHALGADDVVLQMYKKAWEGHLRQYTEAKTVEVPLAREGMYYKEFPVMFDWLHNGEGLTVFNLQGLSDPNDPDFQKRVRRYAGFYRNEDPGAPNYDPEHKIIRSLLNGSRGPLLRKATAVDWAGDPIDVENRFRLGHGEKSYQQMLAHFKDYTDIVGDHPLNLLATSLAMNAYMLTGQSEYRRWLLEYVDAWRQRMIDNGYIIPTNIGLDGKIGSQVGGKWYGGVYGWSFTVVVPQDGSLAHRNLHHKGFTGFMNAYMLTGDDRYLEPWRRQIDTINAQRKVIDGRAVYPRMYNEQGWYHYVPEKYDFNALEIYYLSMKREDRQRLLAADRSGPGNKSRARDRAGRPRAGDLGWLEYLDGWNPPYPEAALRADFGRIGRRVQAMRRDPTTPDTRLADDPMKFNPASVGSLIHLMLGGLHPGHQGSILHCRLRYFDPLSRRAGIPPDVGALVEQLSDTQAGLTLVNLNQVEPRTLVVQAGGYGEHQFTAVKLGAKSVPLSAAYFTVRLAPGCGARMVLRMNRYANQPTLAFPWLRTEPK